jgi:hypothetical protein
MLLLQTENNLNRIIEIEESFDAINNAVSKIQAEITDMRQYRTRKNDKTRLPVFKSATITPIKSMAGISRESFGVFLRNISSLGFSLSHYFFLERGYVLLEFNLKNQETVKFIADLLWCEQQSDGCYFSGGKFLEVVKTDDLISSNSNKPELAEATCS